MIASYPRMAILAILVSAAPSPAKSDEASRTLPIETLRSRLREAQGRIRSLSVTYQSAGYDGGRYPAGTFVRQRIVVKSPSSVLRVSAHGHDRLDWRDDPLQQWGYVVGGRFINFNPVNRTYKSAVLKADGPVPQKMMTSFFFMATGIWPLDGRPTYRPGGRPYMLRDVASSDDFRLRPRLELVKGRWCHVLEHPAGDRIWLDAERGCALLAREIDDPGNGYLMQRYELDDQREVAAGIWFPGRIRTVQYDTAAGTDAGRHRKVKDGIVELTDVHVNDVDDQVFEFTAPPGSLRMEHGTDHQSHFVQAHPGGTDHLDRIVFWLGRHSPPRPQRGVMPPAMIAMFLAPVVSWLACSLFEKLGAAPRRRGPRPDVALERGAHPGSTNATPGPPGQTTWRGPP